MSDLNNIEQKLKAGATEPSPFEYKDAYWTDALAALKKAERAAFYKKFFFFFLAFSVLGVGSYLLIFNSPSLSLNKADLSSNKQTELLKDKENQNLDNSSNNLVNNNDNSSNNELSVNSEGGNSVDDNSNVSSNSTIDNNNNLALNSEGENINSVSSGLGDGASTNIRNNSSLNNTSNSPSNQTSRSSGNGQSLANESNGSTSNTNEGSINANNTSRTNIIGNNTNRSNLNSNRSINNNSTNLSDGLSLNNNISSPSSLNDKQSDNNNVSNSLSNVRAQVVLEKFVSTKLEEVNKTDLKSYPLEEAKVISLEKKGSKRKISLIANIGTVYSQGFYNGEPKFDLPYLGGEVAYQLTNKLNVSLGAGYYNKTNINQLIEGKSSVIYGFGKTTQSSYISLDEVSFLEIPLKVSYAIKPYLLVGTGVSYSHVIGGKNRAWNNINLDAENANLDALNDFQSESQSLYTNVYAKGSYDLFGSIEGRYKRFGAELRYYYGLNDMSIYKGDVIEHGFDRNSRFLITFKFLLFK